MRRLKVLLSAYACEPHRGSEPAVGWHTAVAVAQHHDAWVVTREANRPEIEKELAVHPVPGLRFVYYDLPRWARFWKRGQRGVRAYYGLWQRGIAPVVRRLHAEVRFDVTHHVTFVKYWSPSPLASLPVPFIWGPVGGADSVPRPFWRALGLHGGAYEATRSVGRWLMERTPAVRSTARKSAIALATTAATVDRVRRLGAKDAHLCSQVGLPAEELASLGSLTEPPESPLRFISLGNLLALKGYHIGLRAFAKASMPNAEYWLVGGGPERARLEALSSQLGIENRVRFWGTLPRSDALTKLGECHVLVHPSLHDSGGWVCLEAMAASRPVICLDLAGPALLVTPDCGIKVAAITPAQTEQDMAAAMRRMANPHVRTSFGSAGRDRATREFNWEHKVAEYCSYYEDAVERTQHAP